MEDKSKLRFAQLSSWIVGIVSTLLAVRFLRVGQGDMFLYFQSITGLLGGPIASVFLAGIFFKNISSKDVWIGFIVSVIIACYISDPAQLLTKLIPNYTKPQIFEFLISFIIIGAGVIVSIISSIFTAKPAEEKTKGLTYSSTKDMAE